MAENILTNFAELVPSYKSVSENLAQKDTKNDKKLKQDNKQDNMKQSQAPKVTYVPDMAEPRTYLAVVMPQLLQLTMPRELSNLLRRKLVETKKITERELNDKTDKDILLSLGFQKSKIGSRYSLVSSGGVLCLRQETETGKIINTSGGVQFTISVICEAILDDLHTALTDLKTTQDRDFRAVSNKIVYNPFYRIAAILCALALESVPNIVGLLLMDKKLSLLSLSFMLRATRIPPELKEKYAELDSESSDPAIKNVRTVKEGELAYDFLVADGTYEYVKVKWTGISKMTRTKRSVETSSLEIKYNIAPEQTW